MADGFLPPVVAVLTASIGEFTAKMGEAKGEMADVEATSGKMGIAGKAALLGIGAGAAVLGVESVKLATDFQTQMAKLYTAAGAPKQAILDSSGAILSLATSVGQTGTAMAEALYHPISAGLDLKTSLNVVKYAAEEAQISGANLDDTTYSLSSVMKAFNQSAADAEPTMAQLNAIVGEGDMRFQDFNASIKNWAPTAAQMGISIQSMGAGLAYLTDRGNSAEVAATRMTMGITMMSTPTKQAGALLQGLGVASSDVSASSSLMVGALKKAGVTQNTLAMDLKKPDGLYVALSDLKDHLKAAGVSGTEADSTLSKIFGGGRSDKAIMSLMQNLDGLKDKYDAIGKDSSVSKFEQNWQDASTTFGAEMKKLGAFFTNLGIEIGTKLLPILTSMAKWFMDSVSWLGSHKVALIAIASGAIPLVVAGLVMLTAAVWNLAAAALETGIPELIIIFAALGVGVYELITHWQQFMDFLKPIGAWIKAEVIDPIIRAWNVLMTFLKPLGQWMMSNVINPVVRTWKSLVTWAEAIWPDVVKAFDNIVRILKGMFQPVFNIIMIAFDGFKSGFIKAWDDIGKALLDVWNFVKAGFTFIWDVIVTVIKSAVKVISGIVQGAINIIKGIIDFVVGVFSGDWKRAWDGIKEVFTGIWDVIKGILGGVWSFITGIFKDARHWLWDAGKAILNGLLDGLKSAWNAVTGFIGGIGNWISSHKGPIEVDRVLLTPHGKAIMGGLLSGLQDGGKGVQSYLDNFTTGIGQIGANGTMSVSHSGLSPMTAGTGGQGSGNVYITVQGTVVAERDLQTLVQKLTLQFGARNNGNGLNLVRVG